MDKDVLDPLERPTRMQRLLDSSGDLLAVIDCRGNLVEANAAWQWALGWSRRALFSQPLTELVHPEDRARTIAAATAEDLVSFENRYRCRDGSYKSLRWWAQRDGEHWFAQARVAERPMLQASATDLLTGLPDRVELVGAQRRFSERGATCSLALVDIDRFAAINDLLGASAGDELLRACAERLTAAARGSLLARVGADRFAILRAGPLEAAEAAEWADEILALFTSFHLGGGPLQVTARVGMARTTGLSADRDLLRDAELALASTRLRSAERPWALFDEEMEATRERRIRLRGALDRDELELHYQPVVPLRDGAPFGAEALMRWRDLGRLRAPESFIGLAEADGSISVIGRWALGEACRQMARQGGGASVWVNLSARQFDAGDLPEAIAASLAESCLPPERLYLELSETIPVADLIALAPSLRAIRESGVRVAIDDFGAGSTSLSHLRELPIDVIKIDRAFVAGIHEDQSRAIVSGILAVTGSLGIDVVAEGVETSEQAAILEEMGCPALQGFHFGRPGPDLGAALAKARASVEA